MGVAVQHAVGGQTSISYSLAAPASETLLSGSALVAVLT